MTYGDNSRQMRESMAWLLGRHRILQRLGGQGSYTIKPWSTEAERERMGKVIQRYRFATLTWCLQAVTASTPKTDLSRTSRLSRRPMEDLRYQLGEAADAAGTGEPLSALLGTPHNNDLMDAWQLLARAATLGEHDFAAGVNFGKLPSAQSRTVLKDAADLTRALVILDQRYKNIPGWQHLKEPRQLNRSAENASLMVGPGGRDRGVDEHGWRPKAGVIAGRVLPGIAGAVQAQHNMFLDLGRVPNALNLRRIFLSQARLSHEAAMHAVLVTPDLVEAFEDRARTYGELVRSSRDVAGLAGAGGYAAAESQNAAARLERASTPPSDSASRSLHELARLCTRTDARLATTIEHGFNERLYFVAVNYPGLTAEQVGGVHPTRQRWVPVTSAAQAPLLDVARQQLRPPPPVTPPPSPESRESREAYDAILSQEIARVGHARRSR